jgi:hypothetical protein
VGYFPLDFWAFSARAWRRIAPEVAVLTEGERWPEHIAQAAKRGVPLVVINARLSDRSFRRMQWVKASVSPLFGGLTRILAASEHDAGRFRALGFAPEKITVTGNLKLDVMIPPLGEVEKAKLRRELGLAEGARVLLGSSTWPGEEEALLAAQDAARQAGVAIALLIVPRHAERRDEIEALLKKSGRPYHFRSRGAVVGQADVAVGDTTGELRQLAQLADLVFCAARACRRTPKGRRRWRRRRWARRFCLGRAWRISCRSHANSRRPAARRWCKTGPNWRRCAPRCCAMTLNARRWRRRRARGSRRTRGRWRVRWAFCARCWNRFEVKLAI